MLFGKELILLPQTYGPYKRKVPRLLARHVLRHASAVYARDRAGVEYVRDLLGHCNGHAKVRFAPDVAFVLDAREPDSIDVGSLKEVRTKESVVVGLNISGLLFNGGYTRQNMFGLKTDYRDLIQSLIECLLQDEKVLVLLVPHVLTPDWIVEDDPNACRQVYEQLGHKYPDRIFITGGPYNQNDIKYIIGLCDFFIGSRMHSCIAALSQCIPTVGIAYSKKFRGVFESVRLGDYVADACQCGKDELLSTIRAALEKRDTTRVHLQRVIPEVQADVLNMLDV
jgi:polysaccharide pyruvyl transferase WcaK-like protein